MVYIFVFFVKYKYIVRNIVMKVMVYINIYVLLVIFVNIKKYFSYVLYRLIGEINWKYLVNIIFYEIVFLVVFICNFFFVFILNNVKVFFLIYNVVVF